MRSLTVVIVDDSAPMRAGVRQLLEEEFEIVAEAADGLEAVEVAGELSPDAIVMDITMPGVGGIEAARQLRENGCGSAVIFLSAHQQRRIVSEALQTSRSGYVAKPDARRELAAAVSAVVDGDRFLSSSLAR